MSYLVIWVRAISVVYAIAEMLSREFRGDWDWWGVVGSAIFGATTRRLHPMHHVVIDGVRFACPFGFPALTADEESYLRESIGDLGVVNPILTYDSPNWGPALIQGGNRFRISQLLGRHCPRQHLTGITDETAQKMARDIQAAGRQLSQGQVEQARRDRTARLERVATQRAAGVSIRGIAEKEGVSKSQIERDLEHLSPPGTTELGTELEEEFEEVVGRDGKHYPRNKPKPTPTIRSTSPADIARDEAASALDIAVSLGRAVERLYHTTAGAALVKAAKKRKVPLKLGAKVVSWPALAVLRGVLAAVVDHTQTSSGNTNSGRG